MARSMMRGRTYFAYKLIKVWIPLSPLACRFSSNENPPAGPPILVRGAFQKRITKFYNFEARFFHLLLRHLRSQLVVFDLLVSGLCFAAIPDTFHENEGSSRLQRGQRMAQHGLMRRHLVI